MEELQSNQGYKEDYQITYLFSWFLVIDLVGNSEVKEQMFPSRCILGCRHLFHCQNLTKTSETMIFTAVMTSNAADIACCTFGHLRSNGQKVNSKLNQINE